MTHNNLYLLLDVIFRNGSVKKLIRLGIDYNEIAIQTNKAIQDGLLMKTEDRIILTASGLEVFKQLEEKYKKTNKDEWIEKDLKSQIAKIDKNSIFLPKQNALTF